MSDKNSTAVILIHGIGDLKRGDVLNAASDRIRKSFSGVSVSDPNDSAVRSSHQPQSRAYLGTLDLRWKESRIRLIEYYWAQIPGKIRALNPLRALIQILGTLNEFPRMSISATSSTGMRRLAAFYGRSQQVTVLVAIVLATITIVQGIQSTTDSGLLSAFDDLYLVAELDRQGKATQEDARTASKALGSLWQHNPAFVILVFLIPFVSGTWLLMLIGCIAFPVTSIISPSRFQHVGILWRTCTASGLLVVFAIWIIVFIAQGVLIGVAEAKAARSGQIFPLENDPLMITILALMLLVMTKAGLITANLLRDIVHYLATDSAGRPLATQQTIQTELWRVIEQLRSDRDFRKIVMVAHSLGTVILVDLLRNRARETPTADPIHIDIVTAGSPLLRLIYRFLPNRLPAPATIYSELTQSRTIRVSRWLNVYRPLDYVGQALNRRIDPADGILDHPLRPRLLPPFGHANYWGDSRFLDFITSEVIRSSQSSQHQAHARTATY